MKTTFFLTATLTFMVISSLAQVSKPDPKVPGKKRIISADCATVRGPHCKVFKECIGAGRANEGLRADWQEQLALVQKEIGFKYIRMHGLLHDDMGVYKEDRKGNPIHNWQYIDRLHDALLKLGSSPS